MGRKKIKIEPIQEGRNRQVTYLKRKAGLFKKAYELATLTDSQVAVIVFGHNGRLSQFCSADMDAVLLKYTEHEGPVEHKGPEDFANSTGDDEDDEGDDGGPDSYDPRGPPGGSGGPGGSSGSGGSGGGNRRDDGSRFFSDQGGSSGDFNSHGAGTSSGSAGGQTSGDSKSGVKRSRGGSPSRTADGIKMASPSSSNSSPMDRKSFKEAIRRNSDSRASAGASSSAKREGAATAERSPLEHEHTRQPSGGLRQFGAPAPFEQQRSNLSTNGVVYGAASQQAFEEVSFPSSSSMERGSGRRSIAHYSVAMGEGSNLPLSGQALPNQMIPGPSGWPGRASVSFDVGGEGAGVQWDYTGTSRGALPFQQQDQQQQQQQRPHSMASAPLMRQPSFASLEEPGSSSLSRGPSQGTTPFLPGMQMSSGIQSGRSAMMATSPTSPPTNPYASFGNPVRPFPSRESSTPGLSTSSQSHHRRGTDDYGTLASASSTDGTPLLASSSLATPSESPMGFFAPGSALPPSSTLPFAPSTGYFVTNAMGEPAKNVALQANPLHQPMGTIDADAQFPQFGSAAYFGL